MRDLRLGELIEHVKRPVQVDPARTYVELGTRMHFGGLFEKPPVTGEGLGNKKVFWIEPGDLVLNIIFACGGAIAVADETASGKIASHRFPTYRAIGESCDVRYMRLFFETPEGMRLLTVNSPGSAGSNKTLNQKALLRERVRVHDLAEQRRIVDLIAAIDEDIAAADEVEASARIAREAVLAELLEAGGEDWVETTLGEVSLVSPKEPPLPENAPFVPMDAVEVKGRWVKYTEPRGSRGGARARSGDTLFARITPCLENGKIGQVPANLDRVGGSTELIVLRAGPLLGPDFLFFWATAQRTRSAAEALMTGTTGRQRVSANDLSGLRIAVPPRSGQQRIVDTISAFDEVVSGARAVAASLRQSRISLLADLLSGGHGIPSSYERLLEAS
jgi:type I restriction enzyme S subunit